MKRPVALTLGEYLIALLVLPLVVLSVLWHFFTGKPGDERLRQ